MYPNPKVFALLQRFLMIGLATGMFVPVLGQQSNDSEPRYKTGFGVSIRIGMDLYKALDDWQKKRLVARPVSLETDVKPYLRSVEESYEGIDDPMRMVFISIGFIDLLNNVAHAKAIDQVRKGYFEAYVLSLSKESGETSLNTLPDLDRKDYWTDDMMNEQLSNFYQMASILVGIQISHFYLGHFDKYKDKLKGTDGKPVPLNQFLTEQEWEKAVNNGVKNALLCGYGIQGVIALYETIDQMAERPEWTTYFVPNGVKIRTLVRDLRRKERDFFSGF